MTTIQTPTIGQPVTVRGVPCEIIRIHPAGTIDVASVDPGDNRAFRITGLAFAPIQTPAVSENLVSVVS